MEFILQTSMEEVARGDPKVNQSSLLQKLLSEWLPANALHSKGIYVIYVWTRNQRQEEAEEGNTERDTRTGNERETREWEKRNWMEIDDTYTHVHHIRNGY